MTLAPGSRLGPYEITAQIGLGGMGEVYRATDTKLKRQVAIKVLPAALAGDPERLARFQREAEVLASLNHPNIAQIHGLEDADGVTALVMELVEGPTLADRIAQGAIPVHEALPIAKQIAEALEAAHEQGIIHRDLKPANIKVRADGTVKVLDFGLAKAMDPAAAMSPSVSQAPTITSPAMMTGVGMILGTAAYMSPEQARGKTVDKRADIWAFGAVLFEMLTGRRAFPGEDVTDTLAAVVRSEPAWGALPSDLSPALAVYLKRCLHKDPKQRIPDIAAMRLALGGAFETVVTPSPGTTVPTSVGWRRAVMPATMLVIGGAIVGVAVWFSMRPALPRIVRMEITTAGAEALSISGGDRDFAITRDGSRIVYRGQNQLLVRGLDQLTPVALTGLGAPRAPFVSPDGQWVGFFDGNTLSKVAVTGGAPVIVTAVDGNSRGATWGMDDTIIFATNTASTGLQQVSAAGGEPRVLTMPDRDEGQADHYWPEVLPGGRAVLFTIMPIGMGPDNAQIAVLDLRTNIQTVLVRGGSHAHYVSSGHLVYGVGGTLRAVAFDLGTLETRGTPVPVIPRAMMTTTGSIEVAVAGDGTLVYVPGGVTVSSTEAPRTLVWVDRQGLETPIPAPPRAYAQPRLSPEGTRIAVVTVDQELDLWLWDLMRSTLTRLTFEPGSDTTPVWTPDGRRLAFSSARTAGQNIYVQSADGTGSATRMTDSPNALNPTSITSDGTRIVFHERAPARQRDLRLLTLTPTPKVEPLLETRFEERGGALSPDGRWLAYESDNSGRFEIYVRPFPDVSGGQWQISTDGGVQALWARDGRELFYMAPDGALLTVPVESRGSSWSAGTATTLVRGPYYTGNVVYFSRHYDVSPDGQRFLMIKEGSDESSVPPRLIVVQNWTEELKRLVPTN